MGLDIYAGKLKHQYSYDYTDADGKDRKMEWTNVGPFEGVYDETLYEKKET